MLNSLSGLFLFLLRVPVSRARDFSLAEGEVVDVEEVAPAAVHPGVVARWRRIRSPTATRPLLLRRAVRREVDAIACKCSIFSPVGAFFGGKGCVSLG